MNTTLTGRINRMMLVFLSTFILVVASFFMIYGLNLQKRELDIFTDSIALTSIKEKLKALSLFIAIVIIIINNILKGVVRYLTLYERHETVTA
jgi:hypothetical protein